MDQWDDVFERLMKSTLGLPPDVTLSAAHRLVDLGVDSIQMMALMGDLEEAYDIMFDEAVTFEMFGTVGMVWQEIERARSEGASPST